jgi:integrase/recombinase XerD
MFHPSHDMRYVEKTIVANRPNFAEGDEELIRRYVREHAAEKQISDARQVKITSQLCLWKRYLSQAYCTMTYDDILAGIEALRANGYSQNTKGDFIKIGKAFWLWLAESGINPLPVERVRKIKPPGPDLTVTEAVDIFTPEEVAALVNAAGSQRDKAFISTLFESGARIGEMALLTWNDVVFDEYGVKLYITDKRQINAASPG